MRSLLLVVALLAASPAAAAPTPEATARKDQGDARRDAGDNTGALAAYREALQISADYVEAWEEIGKLYFGAKDFREAAAAFQRAVEIDGSYANNWFNLALAARRAGELARSRDAFRRYLAIKPDDADGRLRLAEVLRALGEREAAIKEFEAVVVASDARAAAPALGDRAKAALAQLRAEAPAPTIVAVAPAQPAVSIPLPPAPAPVAAAPAPPSAPVVTAVVTPVIPPPVPAPRPVVEPTAPPSPALLDKLALGDRLQGAGDYRGALFAFQDAVYLEPRHAVARVKLGRAYWILRYVGQAEEQWQQAGQLAPNDPSIAHMIEEARKAPRPAIASTEPATPPAVTPAPGTPSGGAPAYGASGSSAGGSAPRVYRFVPEPQGAPAQPAAAPMPPVAATTPGYGMPPPSEPAPYSPPQYAQPPQQQYAQPQYAQPGYGQPAYPQAPPQQPAYAQPQPQYAQPAYPPPQPAYGQPAPQPSAAGAAAAQRYRAALSLYIQRDYLGAIAELDAAITLDPNLSVAYTARGSSKFGLGKYREAAADYKAALDLDAAKAEPIWGLAECQRMLRDPAAPDTYRRYAASVSGDVNEDRRAKARRWATELSGGQR